MHAYTYTVQVPIRGSAASTPVVLTVHNGQVDFTGVHIYPNIHTPRYMYICLYICICIHIERHVEGVHDDNDAVCMDPRTLSEKDEGSLPWRFSHADTPPEVTIAAGSSTSCRSTLVRLQEVINHRHRQDKNLLFLLLVLGWCISIYL